MHITGSSYKIMKQILNPDQGNQKNTNQSYSHTKMQDRLDYQYAVPAGRPCRWQRQHGVLQGAGPADRGEQAPPSLRQGEGQITGMAHQPNSSECSR